MLHYTMDEARQDWTSAPRMYIWKHPTQTDKEPEITYDEANPGEPFIVTGELFRPLRHPCSTSARS